MCKKCGITFTTHITQVRVGNALYCSRSCARSGSPTRKKTSPVVDCATCGKRFNKYQAEIKKNVGKLHFCSPLCWYSYNQRDNHYLWGGGQNERMNPDATKWRKAVLTRDKYFCRICHARRRLEAHHIRSFTKYPDKRWDVSNGITLCHKCHVKTYRCEDFYAEVLTLIASIPLVVWRVDDEEGPDTAAPAEVLQT